MQNSYDNQEKLARQNSCCASGNLEYAGFWVRMAAYMIDSVVVFAGLLIVRLIFAGISLAGGGAITGTDILFHYSLKDIILYALKVLYFIAFTYLTGTTLGKKAMNLRVVSKNPEEKLTLFNVVYRETVGRFLCSLPVNIGYIVAGIDSEKRGFHDLLCDTRVVYQKKIKAWMAQPGRHRILSSMRRMNCWVKESTAGSAQNSRSVLTCWIRWAVRTFPCRYIR